MPNRNWKVVLTSLTYTNVVLHIQQPPGTDVLTDNLGTIDPYRPVTAHPRESRQAALPFHFAANRRHTHVLNRGRKL